MENVNQEVIDALEEIKASVEAKFAGTALAADVEAAIAKAMENMVGNEEVAELKSSLEKLEAKLDAIPSPVVISRKAEQNMNVHSAFTKSLELKGKAEAEIFLKNITATTNIVGAPEDTYGLTGSMFASNPFRQLASTIETTSKALILPIRTGSHGAASANNTVRALTSTGSSAAVSEITVMVSTIEALTDVTVEAADDIIGFDNFWAQDMLDEVAAIEAARHVAVVEGIAGVTSGANTSIDLDDLAELHFSVAPQYRSNGAFVVSTDAMRVIRTLNTASTGGDLVFDAQLGAFRLFGAPIYENAYMADVAAGNVVAAYGDFKKGLVIANRASATVGRYEQTKPGYYTYHASLRSGAAQWHAPAVKTLTVRA